MINERSKHNLEPDFIQSVFQEFFSIQGDVQIIIRGHLYCELALRRLIWNTCSFPDLLNDHQISFYNILIFSRVTGIISQGTYATLYSLNNLRNGVAHKLDYKLSEKSVRDLINVIKSGLKNDNNSSLDLPTRRPSILKIAKWYFDPKKTPSIMIRRAVFFHWLLMELDISLRIEGLGIYNKVFEKIIKSQILLTDCRDKEEYEHAVNLLKKLSEMFAPFDSNSKLLS